MGLKERENRRTSTIAAISGVGTGEETTEKSNRGRKKNHEKKVQRIYYLTPDLVRALEYRAFKDKEDKSSIVRDALRAYLATDLKDLKEQGEI